MQKGKEMQIVTTIRVGYIISTDQGDFEVLGSRKFRSGQKYICKAPSGATVSLDREDVLEAQRDGSAIIKGQ